jgi:hypothetical protein
MKAKITKTAFVKEYESKFGTVYLHKVFYDGKEALYNSKTKEQNKFVAGQEAEFTEEEKESNGKKFWGVKLIQQGKYSPYAKAVKKEQSRYSGFAVSYAKDLVIAGKIPFNELAEYSTVLFELMVSLDKSLEI